MADRPRAQPSSGASRPVSFEILTIAPWVPLPPTTYSNTVVLSKLQRLAAHHAVTFACGLYSEQNVTDLAALGESLSCTTIGASAPRLKGLAARLGARMANEVRSVVSETPADAYARCPTSLRRTVRRLLAERRFDVILFDYWYTGLGWLDTVGSTPTACYVHDLQYHRECDAASWGASGGRVERHLRRLEAAEVALLSRLSAVACISSSEAETLAARLPLRVRVEAVPVGIDTASVHPSGPRRPDADAILFVGALGSPPNRDAVISFSAETWPAIRKRRPSAKFFVVGRDAGPEVRELCAVGGIHVVGGVDDVRPWYDRASVVVSPLRWGSGMKGKVLEALAMACPLVATDASMEGIDAIDDLHFLRANDPEKTAAAVLSVLEDPAMAEAMAARGREFVVERFDMCVCLDAYESFVQDLALTTAERSARTSPSAGPSREQTQ